MYGTLDESALLAVGMCVATRGGWPAQGHPCVFWGGFVEWEREPSVGQRQRFCARPFWSKLFNPAINADCEI